MAIRNAISLINLDVDSFADNAYFSRLSAGDFIAFPGWPAWHDVHGIRPIMRSGILASDPSFDYTGPDMNIGARRLAFEGFSFDGSSGSPVYALACGVLLTGDIIGGSFRPLKLIGINAGHIRYFDGVHQHSGISYMYKSTVLAEMLKDFHS
jgi:hypothetical protein